MAAGKGEWWSLREDLLLEVYAHNGMTWIQVAVQEVAGGPYGSTRQSPAAPEPRWGRWSEPAPTRQSAERCRYASCVAQLSARGLPEA